MAKETYGRGQLEWALWCSFIRSRVDVEDVPKVFRTRIKRLLEIDRDPDRIKTEVPPDVDHAFAPAPSVQTGETAYSAVDGFCLAIGLDLLDAGFKQVEIVTLMRYLRPELQKRFPKLSVTPPSLMSRQPYDAEAFPHLPSFEYRGRNYADKRVFVVLGKVEVTEIIPAASRKHHAGPVILEPIFCDGIMELNDKLHDLMPNRRRAVTVLEVAANAQAVQAFLKDAPDIRRGRPKT